MTQHRFDDIAYYKRRATTAASSKPHVCSVFVRYEEMFCRRALTTRRDERGRVSHVALIKWACVNDLDPCRRELSRRSDDIDREGDKGGERVEAETRA
jgi:hypothetical protein